MEKWKVKNNWFDITLIIAWLPIWIKQLWGVIKSFPISFFNLFFLISSIVITIIVMAILFKKRLNKLARILLIVFRVILVLMWYPLLLISLYITNDVAFTDNPIHYSQTKFNMKMRDFLPEKIPTNAINVEFYYNYTVNLDTSLEEAVLQYDLPLEEYLEEKENIINKTKKEPHSSEFFDGYVEIDFYVTEHLTGIFSKHSVSFCDEIGRIRFISFFSGDGISYSHFIGLDEEKIG